MPDHEHFDSVLCIDNYSRRLESVLTNFVNLLNFFAANFEKSEFFCLESVNRVLTDS